MAVNGNRQHSDCQAFCNGKRIVQESHVNIRMIQKDILALSRGFTIYTKQGGAAMGHAKSRLLP